MVGLNLFQRFDATISPWRTPMRNPDVSGQRYIDITLGHPLLPFRRTAQTVYYTGELDERAIPVVFTSRP